MLTVDLTDNEHAAVTQAIKRAIEQDRLPRAPRLDPVRSALAKLDPAAAAGATTAADAQKRQARSTSPQPPKAAHAPPEGHPRWGRLRLIG
jgi:hypothetical protein